MSKKPRKRHEQIAIVFGKQSDQIGTLGTAELSSTSTGPERYLEAHGVTVVLAKTGFKPRPRGTTNALVEELMAGPIACTYEAGGASPPCALSRRGQVRRAVMCGRVST